MILVGKFLETIAALVRKSPQGAAAFQPGPPPKEPIRRNWLGPEPAVVTPHNDKVLQPGVKDPRRRRV